MLSDGTRTYRYDAGNRLTTFPALMVAGVRHEVNLPSARGSEVTEVRSGNTPREAPPGELARCYLAGLSGGAGVHCPTRGEPVSSA